MKTTSTAVGRFAPSPSGIMHLGNVASSLLAWLDARSLGGRIILRIEDLDPERSSDAFAQKIADDLEFLGLNHDNETEYKQSDRLGLYSDVFDMLLRRDMLYPCYCSRSERLAAAAPHEGENHCDRGCKCRYLSRVERQALEASGRRPAWKVKVPDKTITYNDGHYGMMTENLADSGDFIIRRSDGVFAYQLAVSFDDMDMGVTRVVRGRDLLSSAARQIWLISELGGKAPEYCHAPLIVSADKRKMSKRDGDLNMDSLREKYGSEELLGYISGLLGLNDGSPVSAPELLTRFDWSKVPTDDIIVK